MSSERPDEFLSWRGRLDQPDALPAQALEDREASWERLAERLRERPRRRWTGYWIAAACLLLLFVPVVHLFRPRPAVRPRPVIVQRQPLPGKGAGSVEAPVLLPDTHAVAARRVKTSPMIAVRHLRPVAPAVVVKKDWPALATPVVSLRDNMPDTVVRVAVQPQPPKKWRVVQYNELDHQGGAAPAMTVHRPGAVHVSVGDHNASLLKISISTQNR